MGEKMDVSGRFVDYQNNDELRAKTGKRIPDNIVLKVKGKEFKIGSFDGKPAELEDAEGKDVRIPVYHDIKNGKEYFNLAKGGKIEVKGGSKVAPQHETEEADADVAPEEEETEETPKPAPKVNLNKVNYRNYLITHFAQCYQDAMLVATEIHKTDANHVVDTTELLRIACALFQKSAANEPK
jgi:hypothetical protein